MEFLSKLRTLTNFVYPNTKKNELLSPEDYSCPILNLPDSNALIYSILSDIKPTMISRFGDQELACIKTYFESEDKEKISWPNGLKETMYNRGGVFPMNDKILTKFSKEFLFAAMNIDVLGVWYIKGENLVHKNCIPDAKLIPLEAIEPYYHINPWSRILEGKKVLVLHPFADTIKYQYLNNRKNLFDDKMILPDFDLITFRAVNSVPDIKNNDFKDWFDALKYMKDEISKINFEIAIIGAGPYGVPLASFIKSLNKKAVHMGGATQIMFGIKGSRWETQPIISKFFNQFWVRPSTEETPSSYKNIENGCYW